MGNDGSDGSVEDASFEEWWEHRGGGGTTWVAKKVLMARG
jgi:hypothetical protein